MILFLILKAGIAEIEDKYGFESGIVSHTILKLFNFWVQLFFFTVPICAAGLYMPLLVMQSVVATSIHLFNVLDQLCDGLEAKPRVRCQIFTATDIKAGQMENV
jgi:hypothetical protein